MKAPKFDTIRLEQDGPVAVLTLNRPEVLNAINAVMANELGQALDITVACVPDPPAHRGGTRVKAASAIAASLLLTGYGPDRLRIVSIFPDGLDYLSKCSMRYL